MGSCMNRHLSKSLVAYSGPPVSTQFKVHLDLYMLCVILDFDELKYLTKTQFEGTYNQILKTCKLLTPPIENTQMWFGEMYWEG